MKIYDCFTFFNELDLLEIRLETLYNVVDKFVIVEIDKTHRGEPKECFFANNRSRFEKYLNKIIYVCPSDVPSYRGEGDWTIENYQREAIRLGLTECDENDIILISDLDEIPNPSLFTNPENVQVCYPSLKEVLVNGKKQLVHYVFERSSALLKRKSISPQKGCWIDKLEETNLVCQQKCFYYYMNALSEVRWLGTTIAKYKNLNSPQILRNSRFYLPYLNDSGWHFSYLGGVEKIRLKLSSIIDSRKSINDKMRRCLEDDSYILYCMENGISLFDDSPSSKFHFVRTEEIGLNNINVYESHFPNLFINLHDKDKRE